MNVQNLYKFFKAHIDEIELNLSIDCVIFTIHNRQLKILLTRIFKDQVWMLPGGFMLKQERAEEAATRILFERTGLEKIYLQQFKIFSDPERFSFEQENDISIPADIVSDLKRLPKRVISIGYFALVNFEIIKLTGGLFKEKTMWAEIHEIPKLKFDHNTIALEALEALRTQLYLKPVGYNLLPEKFTMPELQNLYEIILDKPLERSSFQKKILKWGIYNRLEERREGVAHKRPYLYSFDKEKYEKAAKEGKRFGIG